MADSGKSGFRQKVRVVAFITVILFVLTESAWPQKESSLFLNGSVPEMLAGGFAFTEGPAADSLGNVYFTDQPNDRIYVWTTGNHLELFLDSTGRANGLYFDASGRLLSCSDRDNELWQIGPGKKIEVLVKNAEGRKLNGPNDLWVHPSGRIYFTDPLYVRPYWTRDPAMQQDGENVWMLSADRKNLQKASDSFVKPNGIIGTPDGKHLYVADIGADRTYVFTIMPDGSLTNRRLFAEMGSDGMTLDERGNVYLTGKGVTVFNSRGRKIAHIPVEAAWTANVCFGGSDGKTLFITASEYLLSVRMKVRGAVTF